MNAWTSPNHNAYVAIAVHFQFNGKAMAMLLDLIKVPCSHTGRNLALAFQRVLKDIGLDKKVSLKIVQYMYTDLAIWLVVS